MISRALLKGKLVPALFEAGVIAKGIDGVLEVVGGVLLLLITPGQLLHVTRLVTAHELSEDPHDAIALHLLAASQHLSIGTKTFGALYLLSHGLIKLVLVAGLLLRHHWAYPTGIAAFVLFLVYQLYRYSHTLSPALLALSILDVFVIALTWLEYRRLIALHGFR